MTQDGSRPPHGPRRGRRRVVAVLVAMLVVAAAAIAIVTIRDSTLPRRVWVKAGGDAVCGSPGGRPIVGWQLLGRRAAQTHDESVEAVQSPPWLVPWLEEHGPVGAWCAVRLGGRTAEPPPSRYFSVIGSTQADGATWLEAVTDLSDLAPGERADPAVAGSWWWLVGGSPSGIVVTLAPGGAARVDDPPDVLQATRWAVDGDRLLVEITSASPVYGYPIRAGVHSVRLSADRRILFARDPDDRSKPPREVGWRRTP